MGRIVEMAEEYPAWPRWLVQAREVATALAARTGVHSPISEHAIYDDVGLSARVAKRYVRLYEFLATHYEPWLDGRPIAAGSAAIRELATLHACNPDIADKIAPDAFAGKLRDIDIKRETDAVLAKATTDAPPARVGVTRRIAEFERAAKGQIAAQPARLGIGPIDSLSEPEKGQPWEPDLVAYQNGKVIAIEFKAAGAGASAHIAGAYLARLAQLRERYDDAVLVLPSYGKRLAEAATELQLAWSGRRPHICLIDA